MPFEATGDALDDIQAVLDDVRVGDVDRARKVLRVLVVAVGNRRHHQHLPGRPPRRVDADAARQEVVHIEGQVVAVLLGAADG